MKILLMSALISATLFADSFESFLAQAVEKSPFLKAQKLQIEQASNAGDLLIRYENPNLELEGSSFNPDIGDSGIGYRAALSQPIRLWGVSGDKSSLIDANVALAKANFQQEKAAFVRDISLQYTNYSQNVLLAGLAEIETELATTIFDISKARYEVGSISRGYMLQAKLDFKMSQARLQTQKIMLKRSYYSLLENAGIKEEISIEESHSFSVEATKNENPELLQLKYAQKSALANAQVNTNKIEWMNVVAEYEKEPSQDIFRFGASIPLAFFNTKSQEKNIAKLESTRSDLLSANRANQIDVFVTRLAYEGESLKALQMIDEDILEDEKELLKMYEEGYKIANVNLLALQDAKSRLIETRERLIRIKIERDKNAIAQNYLQGNYND